jgi:hypothetical protein
MAIKHVVAKPVMIDAATFKLALYNRSSFISLLVLCQNNRAGGDLTG